MDKDFLYPRPSGKRKVIDLCGIWKFAMGNSAEDASSYKNGIPGNEWMPVPSSYNDFYTDKKRKEHGGDVWYETSFFVYEEWEKEDILLRFAGVTHMAEVFVNGESMGVHTGGFLPFSCDVKGAVRYGEKNRLVVRVNNELSDITLPVGKTVFKDDGTKRVVPNFDFFNYSGIHRPVKLLVLPENRMVDINLSTDYSIENNTVEANIDYTVKWRGTADRITADVFDENDRCVASAEGRTGRINIQDAVLWEIGKGYLYTLKICGYRNDGVLIDEYFQNFGIRTVRVEGTSLLLNEKPVYLKGFGKHEDGAFSGRGYNPILNKRDFELMKWSNANSFRTSHYPFSEEIMEMADREGFLVIDEAAAVGMQDWEGNWQKPENESSVRYFGQKEVKVKGLQNHIDAIMHLIARDKNHPSVIIWSLMNEPDCSDTGSRTYFEKIFEAAKRADPQKRPCSFSNHTNVGRHCVNWDLCDVIMLNKYYGWYSYGGADIEEGMGRLREELEKWRSANKPVLISEFGADAISGLHKLPGVQWSEEYQAEFLIENGKVFEEFPYIIGEHVWNFADFQTAEAVHRADGNKKGLFTRERQPKLGAYFMKSRWKNM